VQNRIEWGIEMADEILDRAGLLCPMSIVKLAKKMKELEPGQVIEPIVDGVGSKEVVPA